MVNGYGSIVIDGDVAMAAAVQSIQADGEYLSVANTKEAQATFNALFSMNKVPYIILKFDAGAETVVCPLQYSAAVNFDSTSSLVTYLINLKGSTVMIALQISLNEVADIQLSASAL